MFEKLKESVNNEKNQRMALGLVSTIVTIVVTSVVSNATSELLGAGIDKLMTHMHPAEVVPPVVE